MYISGTPGTGKTAIITVVMQSLRHYLPLFEYIEINGMRLTEPRQAYVQIYQQFKGETIPWEQAYVAIENGFKTPIKNRKTIVLLLDELDVLINRRQDVVYNLLNWTTMEGAQLVVVGIANMVDLPERMLNGRVSSRLGLTRLAFEPYSYKQLNEIVLERLIGKNIFNSDALQLVAKSVFLNKMKCRHIFLIV